MSIAPAEPKDKHQFPALSKSHATDVLALSFITGLGDEGIGHIWRLLRNKRATLADFFQAQPNDLQNEFGLSTSAADYVVKHRSEIRALASEALRRATDLDIHILAPDDLDYPAHLSGWYGDEPPLLYARGNLDLFKTCAFAILNSAEPASASLTNTFGVANLLAEAGCTLVTGTENPAYNVVGLAGKRAEGNLIVVLTQGLLSALGRNPEREPIPLARHEHESFDPQRSLLVSPFRLDGRWQKGNGQRRDKLIAALAGTLIAMEIKAGGEMNSLCYEALKHKVRLFVSQQGANGSPLANAELLQLGAHPFVPDAAGSNCDLLLRDAPLRLPNTSQENDLERRRELGQFFTPETVTDFVWEMLEILYGAALPRNASVIDPACGDGVFLRSAVRRNVSREALVGTDIDETLVETWRNDETLRGVRLYRTNGLLDNPSIGVMNGVFDFVVGNPPFSGRGVRDLMNLIESGQTYSAVEPDLFSAGALNERATPAVPSVVRRQRVLLDNLVRHLCRYDCWRLAIEADDGEEPLSDAMPADLFAGCDFSLQRRRVPSDYERMAQLIANWSPDRLLDVSKTEVRDAIKRLASTAIEVFFCERFVRLAKPGGLIAFIVPDSIVASDSLGPLRTWMIGRMDLLAVVSLPQKVFTGVGANAKTSIVFGRRLNDSSPQPGQTENNKNRDDANGRHVLLTAMRAEAKCSLADYLKDVLQSANRNR